MKRILFNSIKLMVLVIFLTSCGYEEIIDAEYPDPVIYMPAAARGMFVINNVPGRPEFHPTPGYPSRFNIDVDNNRFVVPLSVYRSGFEHSQSVDVDIHADTDTISQLISAEEGLAENVGILPSQHYSLPSSVTVQRGDEIGSFSMEVDLDYLLASVDTVFALGVRISSDQIEVNDNLGTTIIIIHTRILYPQAAFGYSIATVTPDTAQVNFENNSIYAMRYLWDFGDGNTDTVRAPVHYYTESGTYNVSLTAIGVVGEITQDVADTTFIEILLE